MYTSHANTQVPAHRRDQLERLIRYTARGAVSLERLAQDAHGELVYIFTHPWSDEHHRDSPLATGTLGEIGRARAPAAYASGALWGVPGAAQPPAWGLPCCLFHLLYAVRSLKTQDEVGSGGELRQAMS